jgi:uncharacterized protein YbaR (Trm112 family)
MKGENMLDPKLLEILACPNCKNPLLYDQEKEKLVCQKCRVRYPIREDIPILLVEEAEKF